MNDNKPTKRSKPNPIPDVYPSIGACAGRTGIPLGILRLAKKEGCPGFDHSGRVHLLPFLSWFFSRDESSKDWAAHSKKYVALNHELDYLGNCGKLVERSVVQEQISVCILTLFAELEKVFVDEFPASAKGLNEIEIRSRSERHIAKLSARLKTAMTKITETKQDLLKEDGTARR